MNFNANGMLRFRYFERSFPLILLMLRRLALILAATTEPAARRPLPVSFHLSLEHLLQSSSLVCYKKLHRYRATNFISQTIV
jgi:hypothetical protein